LESSGLVSKAPRWLVLTARWPHAHRSSTHPPAPASTPSSSRHSRKPHSAKGDMHGQGPGASGGAAGGLPHGAGSVYGASLSAGGGGGGLSGGPGGGGAPGASSEPLDKVFVDLKSRWVSLSCVRCGRCCSYLLRRTLWSPPASSTCLPARHALYSTGMRSCVHVVLASCVRWWVVVFFVLV
jgi:hypothetical protein